FPAYAAREMGWTDTAMLGAQETAVPGALDRMVRVLIHADGEGPARHVYLGDAAAMRPDLAEEGDAREAAAGRNDRAGPRFGRLLVVGLGLIGGSAALALRQRGLFEAVWGHDVSEEAREQALRAGAVDEAVADPEGILERADVVLLAVPVTGLLGWLERRGGVLRRGTVVVDVGSTKLHVVRAMEQALPEGTEAVGAHPMAGSEESGMGAARPDLFQGARWALVETGRTGARAREVAEAIVKGVGGRPFWTDAGLHDAATATTSHLPYLLSAALALHVEDRLEGLPIRELVGPGAKDMLRLSGSAPDVISDILVTNWPEIREELGRFVERLEALRAELESAVAGTRDRPARRSGSDEHGPTAAGSVRGVLAQARSARRTVLDGGDRAPGPDESGPERAPPGA
ncbi:MAG: chorismate mutase, partial [Gemmatimonadota bacterium]